MAGQPDLTSTSNIQNVVVYVSGDNFSQTYSVCQQNAEHFNHISDGSCLNPPNSLTSMDGMFKSFPEKQLIKPYQEPDTSEGKFPNPPQQSEFPPVLGNIAFRNGCIIKTCGEQMDSEQSKKVQDCCDVDPYQKGYLTVFGSEASSKNIRCDSVHSEAAESSCSSLSSVDENLVALPSQRSNMVVYDPNNTVCQAGVVFAIGPQSVTHQQSTNNFTVFAPFSSDHQQFVMVPPGWKRISNSGSITYISPSSAILTSLDEVKDYLLSAGTCKCGLECHFKYDCVFNFDPKIANKPWVISTDENTGNSTDLCSHKHRTFIPAGLKFKLHDIDVDNKREYIKRKKKKIPLQHTGGLSVSQILAQRERSDSQKQIITKEFVGYSQQGWHQQSTHELENSSNSVHTCRVVDTNHHPGKCQDQIDNSFGTIGGKTMMVQYSGSSNTNYNEALAQNGELYLQTSVEPTGIQSRTAFGPMNSHINQIPQSFGGIVLQDRNDLQTVQKKTLFTSQPSEPSGPGRPNIQNHINPFQQNIINLMKEPILPKQTHLKQKNKLLSVQHLESSKNIKPSSTIKNRWRPQSTVNYPHEQHSHQHVQKKLTTNNISKLPLEHSIFLSVQANSCERVPPLHQYTTSNSNFWQEEIKKTNVKTEKVAKARPCIMEVIPLTNTVCSNADVRQTANENRSTVINNQISYSRASPSFLEDPSGYLAQQTALLNSTINRETGADGSSSHHINSHNNLISLPTNLVSSMKSHTLNIPSNFNQNVEAISTERISQNVYQQYNQVQLQSNSMNTNISVNQHVHCKDCLAENFQHQRYSRQRLLNSSPKSNGIARSTNCSTLSDDPVTSSTVLNESSLERSPDLRPIQGATVSTSNISPMDCSHSDPPSPRSQTPTSSRTTPDTSQLNKTSASFIVPSQANHQYVQEQKAQNIDLQKTQTTPEKSDEISRIEDQTNYIINQTHQPELQSQFPSILESRDLQNKLPEMQRKSYQIQRLPLCIQYQQQTDNTRDVLNYPKLSKDSVCCFHKSECSRISIPSKTGIITTMASGKTVSSNTITSVLAGKSNTSTVSINSPSSITGSPSPSLTSNPSSPSSQTQTLTTNPTKSVLKSTQSTLHLPYPQYSNIPNSHIHKNSPAGLQSSHVYVSGGTQILLTNTENNGGSNTVDSPPPKAISSNRMVHIPASTITLVTTSTSQTIPAMAPQVLGQQTVLVNTLPTPFVLQPGVSMTMDSMNTNQNMQMQQLLASNMLHQQILNNSDHRQFSTSSVHQETKKKNKKRKMSEALGNMVQLATQQNSGVILSPQAFPPQIQMPQNPHSVAGGHMMQTLTIVPNKSGAQPQIVMNGQPMVNAALGTQQLITNSQSAQPINLLQSVNLMNGSTGIIQGLPTFQQFIVPNLGGMVMNPDGTTAILHDTSNLGMHLQIQNVNGQNILAPLQQNAMFNSGQGILATAPTGMVIGTPNSDAKLLQHPQHSPGAQFLSPNGGQIVINGTQFSDQLSTFSFNTSAQHIRPSNTMQSNQQEYIQMNDQMGQTLMVSCTPTAISPANQQNATFMQQNTTIVQQQTTMLANNQQNLQNNQRHAHQNLARPDEISFAEKKNLINGNDNKQINANIQQHRDSCLNAGNYRQSVSTQTAVNQAIKTNTFCQTQALCTDSPPDTTTHSPLASEIHSPATADTTTHIGSTDCGLSPVSSNCSAICSNKNMEVKWQSCNAMVDCISSSEPDVTDKANQNSDWHQNNKISTTLQSGNIDISHTHSPLVKNISSPHATSIELLSSSDAKCMESLTEQQENIVSSRNCEHNSKENNESLLVTQ